MHIHQNNLTPLLRALIFAAAVLAATSPTAFAAPQNPELAARAGDGDNPGAKSRALGIGNLDIDVEITGDTARTVVTASFLNSSRDILEGNFAFDLPPGSVVTGYALDIDGKMVDGVLTGNRPARLTFESRERRGIDPGIAEVTRAGAFTTRVYPILEGKGRTVRLEFVTPLDPDRPFTIPLSTQLPVGGVSIHVRTDAATAPALQAPQGFDLQWGHGAGGFEARASAANRALSGALVLGPVAATQILRLARHHSGDTFFEINDIAPAASDADAHPAHLRIYWDSSLSRRDANLTAEIDLVGRYIAATHPGAVDLVFFSTDAPKILSFRSPGAAQITAILKTTDYQGGTSLKPLLAGNLPAADACLLFSDGNITVDSYRAGPVPCALFAVSSAADANRPLLTALARNSAGAYLDLSILPPDEALNRLLHPAPRIADVRDLDGHAIAYAVLPGRANRIRIVGRAPASGGIAVRLTAQAVRRYAVAGVTVAADDALGALWAARQIDEIGATDRPDQDALLALSRRYSVASPAASFVVFENIQDYVEAGAEPPATLGKEQLAQFRSLKAEQDADKARAQRDRLDRIVMMWTDEKRWWQTQFKPLPPKPKAVPHFTAPPEIGVQSPAPAPSPPPPPPTNALAGNSHDVESVVVTGSRRAGPQGPSIEVTIAPWNPDRPYIAALTAAKPEAYWRVYREQERQYGTLPAFYLDSAEFLFRHGRAADAIRVALNALELPSADTTTMTILADRLMRYGDETRAVWLYERLLYLEPDRPQPRRNLALALEARASHTGQRAEPAALQRQDYGRALDLLNEIVTHDWQSAFDGIEVISLMEANHIIPRLKRLGVTHLPLDRRLVALLDVDLRIVLEWNTDETDMDLWVDEPTGERAIYSNPKTAIGGRLSNDMTNGYGPEEYLLHRAPDGSYTVRVNVYAADRINPNGATTVRAHIFRNYGRANEQEQTLELELKRSVRDDAHLVGTIRVVGNRR